MTAWLLLLSGACNGGDPTGVRDDATLAPVTNPALGSGIVGQPLVAGPEVRVVDAAGAPIAGAPVTWTVTGGSLSSAVTRSDADGVATVGWTLGTVAGPQAVTAHVGEETVRFLVTALPAAPASLRLASLTPLLGAIGDTGRVVAEVRDRFGNQRTAGVSFSTTAGHDVIAIAADGRIVALARGTATVRVAADTLEAVATVTVAPPPLALTRVALDGGAPADTLRPGDDLVLEGTGFPRDPAYVRVRVGGVDATVRSVSPTRLALTLPPAAAFPCQPTALHPVHVRVGTAQRGDDATGAVLLAVARPLALAAGEHAALLDPADRWCLDLAGGASAERRYVVAALNTSQSPSAQAAVNIRGIPGASGAWVPAGSVAGSANGQRTASPTAMQRVVLGAAPAPAAADPAAAALQHEAALHDATLEHSRDIARRYGSPAPVWRALRETERRSGRASASRSALTVGMEVERRVLYSSCTNGPSVRARVVYAGTRALILEDVSAWQAGTMDAQYRALGEEFDRVLYPLLRDAIGDPLAMDTLLGGDGRITMFFTRYVNDELPGIAGYVTSCNFYPRTTFSGSNEDELFYARVASPTQAPADWLRGMRATVLHEAKHLASFAERFSRNHPFEESWLEESTARIAEELYSRTFTGGGAWRGNTGWATSVGCELARCDDRPLVMWKIAPVLHQFWRAMPSRSPLGRTADGDFSFYASGWSLVRWAVDHHAHDERQFLRELVRGGGATGIAALAQRTGRPAAELLAEWALMQAVDGRAGMPSGAGARLDFPSWDLPGLMAGLTSASPSQYPAHPLHVPELQGHFDVSVPSLRGFSAAYVEAVAPSGGRQLVEVAGPGQLGANAAVRVAVVRVQ